MNKRQRKKQFTVLRDKAQRACLRSALAEPNASRREARKAEARAFKRDRRWPRAIRLEDFPPEAPSAFAAEFPFARPGAAVFIVEQSLADIERLYGGVRLQQPTSPGKQRTKVTLQQPFAGG